MDSPRKIKRANSPFNRGDADIVLRSADDVDFQLHKQILSVASPFFQDMFSLEQPPINETEPYATLGGRRIPVVSVAETSPTLDSLFRILYPTEWSNTDIASLGDALGAARKYQLQYPERLLHQSLLGNLGKAPLTVYAIACSLGMESVAALAARSAVGKQVLTDLAPSELPFHISMKGRVSAGQYFRLLQFGASPSPVTSFVIPPISQGPTVLRRRTSGSPPINIRLEKQEHEESLPPTIVLQPLLSGRIPPDIVVRASDGIIIKAHKFILCVASPLLSAIIASPSLDSIDGLPCIRLDTKGTELTRVLTYCYPHSCSRITTLDALTSVVDLARKYEMEGIIDFAKDSLIRMEEYTSDPLRAYCITVYYGWREQARKLGEVFARLPMKDSFVYCPEMELIPAWPYRTLLKHHHRCSNALQRSNPAGLLNVMTMNLEITEALSSVEPFDPGF